MHHPTRATAFASVKKRPSANKSKWRGTPKTQQSFSPNEDVSQAQYSQCATQRCYHWSHQVTDLYEMIWNALSFLVCLVSSLLAVRQWCRRGPSYQQSSYPPGEEMRRSDGDWCIRAAGDNISDGRLIKPRSQYFDFLQMMCRVFLKPSAKQGFKSRFKSCHHNWVVCLEPFILWHKLYLL